MGDTELLKASKKVLTFDEGYSNRPYKDTKGYWTIGVGHFIGADLENFKVSNAVVDVMLKEDIEAHLSYVQGVFGLQFFNSLDIVRQVALLSLGFNLGVNLLQFKNTIELIKQRKWGEACVNLAKSKWAKDVDPKQITGKGRDDRIIYMLKEGKFPQEYGLN